jgi:hypothetical protein
MLVCRDETASERAIAKLAVGSARLFEEFNLDAFLEQHDEAMRGVGRFMEVFATHPWLPKRLLAMRVFSQSALFQAHVSGPGTRRAGARPAGQEGLPMSAVDERVAALLKGET